MSFIPEGEESSNSSKFQPNPNQPTQESMPTDPSNSPPSTGTVSLTGTGTSISSSDSTLQFNPDLGHLTLGIGSTNPTDTYTWSPQFFSIGGVTVRPQAPEKIRNIATHIMSREVQPERAIVLEFSESGLYIKERDDHGQLHNRYLIEYKYLESIDVIHNGAVLTPEQAKGLEGVGDLRNAQATIAEMDAIIRDKQEKFKLTKDIQVNALNSIIEAERAINKANKETILQMRAEIEQLKAEKTERSKYLEQFYPLD